MRKNEQEVGLCPFERNGWETIYIYIFHIWKGSILLIILFPRVFLYSGVGIIRSWQGQLLQAYQQWLHWELGVETFLSSPFFIVNQAPECPYFSHLRLSSICFRNPWGVPVWGYMLFTVKTSVIPTSTD